MLASKPCALSSACGAPLRPAVAILTLPTLVRPIPSHDHSPLHCRKRSTHEVGEHPPTEAVAVRKQLLSGAMPAAMYRNGLVTPTSFSIVDSPKLPAFEDFHQGTVIAAPDLDRWPWRRLAGRAVGLLGHGDHDQNREPRPFGSDRGVRAGAA